MYFTNRPKLKVLYWHTECYNNSENHIRENETYDDFLNRTTNPKVLKTYDNLGI